MKSLTGKSSSTRGWALLLILFLGAGLLVSACGDEEVPAPTTPTPAPAPPPPAPEPEPEPEKPATPTGLQVASKTASSITWTWNAVEGVHGYVVQASADETFDETDQLALTIQPSYTATPLPADTSVYLRVAAGVLTAAAPSLDPSDYLLSDWTTHVTGTTDADASAALAAPANVRVTDQGSNYLEWSWDAVAGAAGYHAQFSRTESFSSPDADRPQIQDTSVRISNLPANSDGYLRVRAYTGSGTGEDTVFGEWSATDMATTGAPPAPPPATALNAPGNVQTSSAQNDSITVTWDDVIDAVEYAVEQRADGGPWGAANCGGTGSNTVSDTRCVASNLDRATDYDFQVRAFPDSADTTLTVSAWSAFVSDRTGGTAPPPPVTGGGDTYDITWESNASSISWTWSRPADGRIRFLIALVRPADHMRPACPPLTVLEADTAFADLSAAGTTGWFGAGADGTGDGLAQYSTQLAITDTGHVRRLCVVPTWKDANGTRQYGAVSSAWAATPPLEPTLESDGRLSGSGTNTITQGHKDDTSNARTTAIDWFVEKDRGFTYEVRTVSASVDDVAPTCRDDRSGSTNLTSTQDNAAERFRLSSLAAYTAYKACVRAVNDQGASGWTELDEYRTRPSAPGSLSASQSGIVRTSATDVTGTLAWSFGASNTTPEAPGGYTVTLYHNAATPTLGQQLPALNSKCGTTGNGTEVTGTSVSETGSGFGFEWTLPTATRQDNTGGVNYSVTVLACVQANVDRAGTGVPGPWRSTTTSVSVPKQTQ